MSIFSSHKNAFVILYKRKSHANNSLRRERAFTLIELLITIAILGILAAIVIPSYNAQVRKGSRSDAITALGAAASDLERCRSDTLAFNAATCTDYTVGVTSGRGLYTITALQQNIGNFTLRAVPVNGTTQANDTTCAVFTLDNLGNRTSQDSNGAPTTATCWR